jgi:hypothetical protein
VRDDSLPAAIESLLVAEGQRLGLLGAVVVDGGGQLLAAYFVPGLDEDTLRSPLAIADRLLAYLAHRQNIFDLEFGLLYDLDGRCLAYGPVFIRDAPYLLILLAPPDIDPRQTFEHLAESLAAV